MLSFFFFPAILNTHFDATLFIAAVRCPNLTLITKMENREQEVDINES